MERLLRNLRWVVEFCPRGPCSWCEPYRAAVKWMEAQ